MFWDKVAGFYDLFENAYNSKANSDMCKYVASLCKSTDSILECACGTGMITEAITSVGATIIATDYSDGMLKKATKKCSRFGNVTFSNANIYNLRFQNDSFDKVIAGNVIHLLDNPSDVLNELLRVCKIGGSVIIPTYVNNERKTGSIVKLIKKSGADFKRQFDFELYKKFFLDLGYSDVDYYLADGRMPCAVAIIKKK